VVLVSHNIASSCSITRDVTCTTRLAIAGVSAAAAAAVVTARPLHVVCLSVCLSVCMSRLSSRVSQLLAATVWSTVWYSSVRETSTTENYYTAVVVEYSLQHRTV